MKGKSKQNGLLTPDWVNLIGIEPYVAALWAGVSAYLRTSSPGGLYETLLGMEVPAGPAKLFQSMLALSHQRGVAEVRQLRLMLDNVDDRHGLRGWHCLVAVWGMAILAGGTAQFRAMLEAANARELSDQLARQFDGVVPKAGISIKKSLSRVAVVSSHLSQGRHPATRLVVDHAALLARDGLAVKVFAAQDFSGLDFTSWLGTDFTVSLPEADPSTWHPSLVAPNFEAYMADTLQPIPYRWLQVAQALHQFEPDVVLYIGFCSPLQSLLHSNHPLVALSVHHCPPLGRADVWLDPRDQTDIPEPWLDADCLAMPYGYRLPPESPLAGPAESAAAAEPNCLTLITIGNRLSVEMSPEWTAGVLQRLEKRPSWRWLLLGNDASIPSLPPSHPQVINLGHRSDVVAHLSTASICLNPPRMGGGFSVIEAMSLGVPVLSHAGGDGGHKLGPYAATDDLHYWQLLDQWMEDPAAREGMAVVQRERYESHYNLMNAGPALAQALAEGQRRGLARLGLP